MKKLFTLALLAAVSVSAVAANGVRASKSMAATKTSAATAVFTKQNTQTMGMKVAGEQLDLLKVGKHAKAPRRAVTDPLDTMYFAPTGTFFSAPFTIPTDEYWHTYAYYMVPNGVELTWTNSTAPDTVAADYTWLYVDKFSPEDEWSQSTDRDLKTTFDGSVSYVYGAPRLYVNDSESYYQLNAGRNVMYHGGTLTFEIPDQGFNNLAVQFDPFANSTLTRSALVARENIENGWIGNQHWTEIKAAGLGCDSLAVIGAMERVAYPGRPYVIKSIQIPAYVVAEGGATVNLSIVGYNAEGLIDLNNPIATSSFTFDDDVDFAKYNMDFKFETVDEYGLPSDLDLVITDDIFVLVTGPYTDPMFSYYTPLSNHYEYDFDKKHDRPVTGYALLQKFTDGAESGLSIQAMNAGYYWGNDEDGYALPANLFMLFDVAYPFIESADAVDNVITLDVDEAGEAKEVVLNVSDQFDAMTISGDESGLNDLPEWLTVEGVDGMSTSTDEETGETSEYFNGEVTLTITAAAGSNRKGEIYVSLPSQLLKIVVNQGVVDKFGDINGDGEVDVTDLNIVINVALGKEENAKADVSGDGVVDVTDINMVLNAMLLSE